MPSAYTLRGRASELTDGEVAATAASIAGCWCGAGACGEDMGSYQTVCAAAAAASGTAASSAGFIGTARSWSVATEKKGGNGFGGRGKITTGTTGTAKGEKVTVGRLQGRCGSHNSREAVAIYGTGNARWYVYIV